MKAKPFLKWVGGKSQLLPQILDRLSTTGYYHYHEPFLGGGAVFFSEAGQRAQRAVLMDANPHLVSAYQGVRDDPEGVIARLAAATNRGPEAYAAARALDPATLPTPADVAAWFIYINKLCFNGIWRVNRSGQLNTPYGKRPEAELCDPENIRACSTLLKKATILHSDFRRIVDWVQPGDVVYLDPPYAPVSETADFTSYTKDGFTLDEQSAVRDVALSLSRYGCFVVVSNADVPLIRQLYNEQQFIVDVVPARRNINSDGAKRGPVAEVLMIPR